MFTGSTAQQAKAKSGPRRAGDINAFPSESEGRPRPPASPHRPSLPAEQTETPRGFLAVLLTPANSAATKSRGQLNQKVGRRDSGTTVFTRFFSFFSSERRRDRDGKTRGQRVGGGGGVKIKRSKEKERLRSPVFLNRSYGAPSQNSPSSCKSSEGPCHPAAEEQRIRRPSPFCVTRSLSHTFIPALEANSIASRNMNFRMFYERRQNH